MAYFFLGLWLGSVLGAVGTYVLLTRLRCLVVDLATAQKEQVRGEGLAAAWRISEASRRAEHQLYNQPLYMEDQ